MEERPPDSPDMSASPVVPPSPADPPPGGAAEPAIPWEQPGVDVFSGFFRTIGLLFRDPRQAFRRVPLTTSPLRPFAFGYVVYLIAVWCSTFWEVALRSVWSQFVPQARDLEFSAAMQILGGLAAPLWVPVMMLISIALQHLFLIVVGGAKRGFGATLRAMSYAWAPHVLVVVPLCGTLAGTIWGVVLVVIGLSTLHGIPTGKAVLAVLLPLVLCCACIALGIGLFGSVLMGALASRG